MPISFFIPQELDISGVLTVEGNLITARSGRLQAGTVSTLMTSDSGTFASASSVANLSTVQVSGSAAIPIANFTGLGGTVVLYSGGFIFISGAGQAGGSFDPLGTAAATGQLLGGQINALSGLEIAISGVLQTQINAISASGGGGGISLGFDFRSNIGLSIGVENPFIPFSSVFGATPFVLYSLVNNSGDGILNGQLSGISTTGFFINLTAAPTTSNYKVSYLATTGNGITTIGGGGGGGGTVTGSYDPLGTAAATGLALAASISASGQALVKNITGAYINFAMGSNLGMISGQETQTIPFSGAFGATPFVLYTIMNTSGDPIFAHYLSSLTSSGFSISLSAPAPSANYTVSYMASTGRGFIFL